jgi:hypothetical protein
MAFRRAATETTEGPASPQTCDRTVRRNGLPDWWNDGNNLLLAGPGAATPDIRTNQSTDAPRKTVVVMGARTRTRFCHNALTRPSAASGQVEAAQ